MEELKSIPNPVVNEVPVVGALRARHIESSNMIEDIHPPFTSYSIRPATYSFPFERARNVPLRISAWLSSLLMLQNQVALQGEEAPMLIISWACTEIERGISVVFASHWRSFLSIGLITPINTHQ